MNNNYKLKILMPLYNREKYIAKALDSILEQKTNFEFQIIIIDDGSTDNSLNIAKEYQNKHDNIKIIENEKNLKLLKTIFKGYKELLNTPYFCVLDPDDYWCDEYRLQKAINFLDKNQDYTIYSTNAYVIDENNNSHPLIKHKKGSNITSTYKEFLKTGHIIIGTTVNTLYRNVVFSNGIPDNLAKIVETDTKATFRGDSFRNYLHLKYGKAFYVDEMSAVYNTASDGIFSNESEISQMLVNLESLIGFSEFFIDDKKYYLKNAYKLFSKILNKIFISIFKKTFYKITDKEFNIITDFINKQKLNIILNKLQILIIKKFCKI